MKENNLITIDGISGAGKGTLAKSLALELGYNILDSGNLYRLVGLISKRLSSESPEKIQEELESFKLSMELDNSKKIVEVLFGEENVTDELRTEEIGLLASKLAEVPSIREILKQTQRDYFDSRIGLVADGRDMGTVIFPQAKWKFFLTASITQRAKRRYEQLKEIGLEVNMPNLVDNILKRDDQDTNRDISPAVPAKDALSLIHI